MDKMIKRHKERWIDKPRIESSHWLTNDHNGLLAPGVGTERPQLHF